MRTRSRYCRPASRNLYARQADWMVMAAAFSMRFRRMALICAMILRSIFPLKTDWILTHAWISFTVARYRLILRQARKDRQLRCIIRAARRCWPAECRRALGLDGPWLALAELSMYSSVQREAGGRNDVRLGVATTQ